MTAINKFLLIISYTDREEVLWLYQEGASYVYPDHWEEFLEPIPKASQHNTHSVNNIID